MWPRGRRCRMPSSPPSPPALANRPSAESESPPRCRLSRRAGWPEPPAASWMRPPADPLRAQGEGVRPPCRSRGRPGRPALWSTPGEVPPDAQRHHDPKDRDREEVDAALDQEERHRAARDALSAHPAAVQHPRPERKPTRAAGRYQRAHRKLRPADLPAPPPSEAGAEDRSEHHDVGAEGKPFQHRRQHEPCGISPFELVTNRTEPRREQEEKDENG